jgi:hypothetical protein
MSELAFSHRPSPSPLYTRSDEGRSCSNSITIHHSSYAFFTVHHPPKPFSSFFPLPSSLFPLPLLTLMPSNSPLPPLSDPIQPPFYYHPSLFLEHFELDFGCVLQTYKCAIPYACAPTCSKRLSLSLAPFPPHTNRECFPPFCLFFSSFFFATTYL